MKEIETLKANEPFLKGRIHLTNITKKYTECQNLSFEDDSLSFLLPDNMQMNKTEFQIEMEMHNQEITKLIDLWPEELSDNYKICLFSHLRVIVHLRFKARDEGERNHSLEQKHPVLCSTTENRTLFPFQNINLRFRVTS